MPTSQRWPTETCPRSGRPVLRGVVVQPQDPADAAARRGRSQRQGLIRGARLAGGPQPDRRRQPGARRRGPWPLGHSATRPLGHSATRPLRCCGRRTPESAQHHASRPGPDQQDPLREPCLDAHRLRRSAPPGRQPGWGQRECWTAAQAGPGARHQFSLPVEPRRRWMALGLVPSSDLRPRRVPFPVGSGRGRPRANSALPVTSVRPSDLTYEYSFVNNRSLRGEYPGFGVTVSSAGSVRPGASAAAGGGGDLRQLA
jgi:hypothetical protein